jgi:hypothetical protein
MARSTFSGPVRSLGGFYTQGPSTVVNIPDATNTITLTVADHAGRLITTNDASLIITLPTINAAASSAGEGPGTGPDTLNNQGASFYIFLETTATAVAIKTDGTDKFVGSISLIDTDSSGAVFGYAPGASNDFINFNGSTTGGLAGTWVKVTALKSLKYLVEGVAVASGIPATPFADS